MSLCTSSLRGWAGQLFLTPNVAAYSSASFVLPRFSFFLWAVRGSTWFILVHMESQGFFSHLSSYRLGAFQHCLGDRV
ncbi:hypothetical protein AG1IA_05315 [Rhizoctonia solani AG-1 IA]|uniref:Uncharacterized protein n=1 Tax=Thanatephorus cucumeris (strain AG1-IA) TaxID=983506 RepID=L8WRM2_THACA|nr:hypothetical protein AG1IA_05315 [Rhizoctonia solani AG-1 IA]